MSGAAGGNARRGAPGPAYAPIQLHAYHLLAAVPGVCMLAGVPFADHVRATVLGLPFLLFWILVWVVATALCMGIVYRIDRERQAEAHMPAERPGE